MTPGSINTSVISKVQCSELVPVLFPFVSYLRVNLTANDFDILTFKHFILIQSSLPFSY